MNEIVNSIASEGQLSQCSSEFIILLYMFVFTFVITVTCTIIGYVRKLGK